ncbi:Holliday junction resolvase RuvX [bacterium]|jgi:putative Holliday junction resolvase|nr:Holliday junction resolvase RuvX [bacterium]MBT4292143.1 Holliday junction resolvase RuvX [bacterium]MBT7311641.1 Holliday junction resolvase RuvX [bacterium]
MSVYLGIDYGRTRTGVAVSDRTGTIASAVGTHHEGHDGSIFDFLTNIINQRSVETIVIGLPLTADGRETESAEMVRKFAGLLIKRFNLPVEFCDERYSSKEADQWLRMSGKKGRPKAETDAVAAEIILQQYLDSLGNK